MDVGGVVTLAIALVASVVGVIALSKDRSKALVDMATRLVDPLEKRIDDLEQCLLRHGIDPHSCL
jgi:hypothetical protein